MKQVSDKHRLRLFLYVLLLFLLVGSKCFGDFWLLPKKSDTLSENGEYLFRVIPSFGSDKTYRPGTCRGMLYFKKGDEISLQWERPLVNDICPICVIVSNSGKYVITIGEWHEYDRLPIVFYGAKGNLINVYGNIRQITDHLKGIQFSASGWHWLSHSLMFFGSNDNFFAVRLCNKEMLVFETVTGQLIDSRWRDENRLSPDCVKEYDVFKGTLGRLVVLKALQLASSDLREERKDGLFVLNQSRDHDSIQVLEQALKDPTSKIVSTPEGKLRKYPIRKAAREALKAMEEKVPDNVVTEEKVEDEKKNGSSG